MAVYGSLMETKEEIMEKFLLLDILCEHHDIEAELLVLGGTALFLVLDMSDLKFRPTRDIDVTFLSASNEEKLIELLDEVQMDLVKGIVDLPPLEDFRDGQKYYIDADFKKIKICVPNVELLACTKIFSTREKDLNDLRNTAILDLCDINKLIDMVREYIPHILNPKNINLNLHELPSILKEKGIKFEMKDIMV